MKTVAKKPAAKKTAKKAVAPKPAPDLALILKALEQGGSKQFRIDMEKRYGIVTDQAWGTPMSVIKAVAKPLGRDRALALKLWDTGWYEARLLASMVDDPAQVTTAQMDRWRRDFDNWGVTDTVCFNLFDRTPHAPAMIVKWAKLNDEFGRRAAFALMACLALHRSDASEKDLLAMLPLIEQASTDERNFVKKAVNWALRALGGRSAKLHAACMKLATQLAASDDATARWIGKDALKGLASPATAKRLARKK